MVVCVCVRVGGWVERRKWVGWLLSCVGGAWVREGRLGGRSVVVAVEVGVRSGSGAVRAVRVLERERKRA